jgi:dTDP-4-amino-4,6-dideoxygalactose transaminase
MHGSKPKYYHSLIGGNFRFDALQAAVINVKLRHLDNWTAGRQANAARYRRLFEAAGLAAGDIVQLPCEEQNRRHVYNQFVIRASRRDELLGYLKNHDVGSEIYYPVPLHLQQCFADLRYKEGDLPHAELAAKEVLAIPIYPELTPAQQDEVAAAVLEAVGG